MADLHGAGSGDRTRITSLEGLCCSRISEVFDESCDGQSADGSGFNQEHRELLPQFYRALLRLWTRIKAHDERDRLDDDGRQW